MAFVGFIQPSSGGIMMCSEVQVMLYLKIATQNKTSSTIGVKPEFNRIQSEGISGVKHAGNGPSRRPLKAQKIVF